MSDGLEYLGRARLRGLTLLGVVFLVGVVAGMAGDRLLETRESRWRGPGGPPPPHGLPRILEDLELTSAQRASIDSLLDVSRPRTEAIMREAAPRLRAVADTLQQQISRVLTPSQRAVFDRFVRSRLRGGWGPPPPPGMGGPPPWRGVPPPGGSPPGGPPPPGGGPGDGPGPDGPGPR